MPSLPHTARTVESLPREPFANCIYYDVADRTRYIDFPLNADPTPYVAQARAEGGVHIRVTTLDAEGRGMWRVLA